MHPGTPSHEPSPRPHWPRTVLRTLGFVALCLVLAGLSGWAAAALHFDVRRPWLGTPLAVAGR